MRQPVQVWLPDREVKVLKMREKRATYQQIADELGCTPQRAKNLRDQAIQRIVSLLPDE